MFELSNPQGQRTYSVKTPFKTHYRLATCAEVECPPYVNGWSTTIDVSTPLGQEQAQYIMHASGRAWQAYREDTLVTFIFPPGQECFGSEHYVPLDRDPFLIVREGGYFNRQHTEAEEWVDDFQNHLDKLRTTYDRG